MIETARETTLSVTAAGFDPALPYALHPQVAIRPEPFGGLAYNYDNRRLTLITARPLVDVVQALADHPSARDAVAAYVSAGERSTYEKALAELHDSGVIRAR
jgi:putative mycofactocin binding protein MftB